MRKETYYCDKCDKEILSRSEIFNLIATITNNQIQNCHVHGHICEKCAGAMGFKFNRYNKEANNKTLQDNFVEILEKLGVKFDE